jgi:hypothetical protein
MRAALLTLIGAILVTAAPVQAARADGHHRHRHVSIGVGVGFPGYYQPYGYYPSYYYGFSIWPRYYSARTRSTAEVRMQTLYVYPAAGQSEARLAEDRYQCHVWAVDSTDFDPTLGAGTGAEADDYARAFTACMEGRDYVVK